MVKAGKDTLLFSPRNINESTLSTVCFKRDGPINSQSTKVLRALRAEFCGDYRARMSRRNQASTFPDEGNGDTAELRTLYRKLQEVIPALSQSKPQRVTSLDVVLGAIDYIRDLHDMLESKMPVEFEHADTVISSSTHCTKSRAPFSQLDNKRYQELAPTDTSVLGDFQSS